MSDRYVSELERELGPNWRRILQRSRSDALVNPNPLSANEIAHYDKLAPRIEGYGTLAKANAAHGDFLRWHPSMYPLPPALPTRLPSIYGGGLALIEALCPELERLGAQIEYETTAVRLLTDDDERVVGIKATDRNHAGVMIKARGIVLACGGFEGNS